MPQRLDVALVGTHVFFPAGEVEHQREADEEVDDRKAFVLNHQSEKHHREGEIRQHIRRQSREKVGTFGV